MLFDLEIPEKPIKDSSFNQCLWQLKKDSRIMGKFTELLTNSDWKSSRCTMEWKAEYTKKNRYIFILQSSQSEYLLRTPTCEGDAEKRGLGNMTCEEAKEKNRTITLSKQIRDLTNVMLPTPTVNESKNSTFPKSQINRSSLIGELMKSHFQLLPTPRASEGGAFRDENGEMKKSGINAMAKMGLLPTPTAFDYNSARTPEKWEEDKQKWADKGVNLQMPLKQMARLKMLPTPTTALTKHSDKEAYWKNRKEKGRQEDLAMIVHNQVGYNFQLNPRFVLEMMGFPNDYTIIPFLKNNSNDN
jgi:hypothetical protein